MNVPFFPYVIYVLVAILRLLLVMVQSF